jgi:glucose/arabinose dehydrogenase
MSTIPTLRRAPVVLLTVMTLAATAGFVRPLLAGDPQSLLAAAAAGHLELVRAILDRGASPDATDERGHTALMLAADGGHRDVAQALLDRGAAVDARTPAGNTALMAAAFRGRLEVVRLLLERGADVTAANADGRTAVTLAQVGQFPAVVAVLLGATPSQPSTASRPSVVAGMPRSSSAQAQAVSPQQVASPQAVLPEAPGIRLEPVLVGLTAPLYVTSARDGSNRLFVVEQGGRILVLRPQASTPTVFLDITPRVLSGGERGLLGLAFHPNYAVNRRFFVNYTRQPDGATVIAQYQASLANPDVAAVAEAVLLVVAQPFANHNGGMLEFGPDGFLYIGLGDGGSANDPGNRAQNVNDLLGKILRIDIDTTTPYSSPPDNPFFGPTAGRDEIFATGFRNPFRFSFDRATGELLVGDVGQGQREEIDTVVLGGNYGWRVFEGTRCTGNDVALCGSAGFIGPVAEYDHSAGRCSITGGYVYRGPRGTFPPGSYVFGDFCTGEIMWLGAAVSGAPVTLLLDTELSISSFGEDEAGEIYVVALDGAVHRIVAGSPPPLPPTQDKNDNGSCFIATAAFGSSLAPEVQTLRNFRDRHLLGNRPGRLLVAAYYWSSPRAAELIREHRVLRAATRLVLRPAVWGARLTETSPTSMLILLATTAGGGGLLSWYAVRRLWARRAAA